MNIVCRTNPISCRCQGVAKSLKTFDIKIAVAFILSVSFVL